MTAYTLELLGRAVEACRGEFRCVAPQRDSEGWVCQDDRQNPRTNPIVEGSTLADALRSLLADLGEEVPEPPSAERVEHITSLDAGWFFSARDDDMVYPSKVTNLAALRDLYARDRLAVLALLEQNS
jgi:hypothetical protein